MQSMKPDAGPAVVTARYKAGCRGSFMRVDDHTEPKIYHRAALFAIGRQLQAEYSVHHPELMPDRLVSLVTKLDRDEGRSVPAQARAPGESGPGEAIGAAVLHFPTKKQLSEHRPAGTPFCKTGELWRFEMLLLNLLESNLEGAARDTAISKLAAYFRVCHTALQAPGIDNNDSKMLLG
jgi:hypothetical protein